jgi:Ca2+/Na+ antiporter
LFKNVYIKKKGSAAFNLLIIISLSIYVAPSSCSNLKIKNNKQFLFSFLFSLFSLIWLYIIIKIITPDQIDIWEAVLTVSLYVCLLAFSLVIDSVFVDQFTDIIDRQKIERNLDNLNRLIKV